MNDPVRPRFAALTAALTVFCLAMLLTAGFSFFALQSSIERQRVAFDALARRTQSAISQRMQIYINLLYAGRAYLLGSEQVTRQDWHEFVSALDIPERYPGMQGLGFSIRIPPGQVAAHEAEFRRKGMPHYRVWPKGDRAETTSILFLEPLDARNQAAIGFDMYSEPVRKEAMARARDSGEPAMSGQVQLVQEITENKQAGFLIYLPLYKGAHAPHTVADRRRDLVGYVYAPFRADDLFNGLFGSRPHPDIDFEIYDGTPSPENLLHDHNPSVSHRDLGRHDFQLTLPTTIAGRTWTIVYTATPVFARNVDRTLPMVVFFCGTLVSLLLAGFTWSLASSRSRALSLATEMTAELRQADRAKDEFLSVISHELRTPLNFIMGFGSILQDEIAGPLNAKQQEFLSKMLNGVDRMLVLVNDLLDFAKIQAGKLDLVAVPTDFVPLAKEVHSTLKPLAEQKGLTFTLDVPDRLVAVLDGPRIVQVLNNLVGNAIKFTPAGGSITLRARREGDDLVVEVQDTGIGIAEDDLPRLFTRFLQLDMSSTRQAGGTGLGLSISKAIIEGHEGGRIGVVSEKGKGSTFWFRLHLDRAPEA